MQTLYPLTFAPIFKERIWGGRKIESIYRKSLPPGTRIGESWEISDRPGDASIIANGSLAGKDLHSLVESRTSELLGQTRLEGGRFPLLVKILDAREKLSLQVHPPADKAPGLGGEPKTEMWYIAEAEPGAELYVGLKRGTTRRQFEELLRAGTVEQCFHRVPVRAGDAMFLPSGRVHAIGAGLVIFEIQQNSDTTYRVFDWNRTDQDGKPRQLHVPESLASIDFNDFEPALVGRQSTSVGPGPRRLVRDPLFAVDLFEVKVGTRLSFEVGRMQILGLVSGGVVVYGGPEGIGLSPGQFCLLPACLEKVAVQATAGTRFLHVQTGES